MHSITRTIRSIMAAQHFHVSFAYASAVLTLMDKLEAGQITEQEALHAGIQLGEQYPEDYKRARLLGRGKGME